MNTESLRAALVRAARRDVPSDAVPHAFEKRILARLAARGPRDPWAFLAVTLWRAVLPACAVMLLTGFGVLVLGQHPPDDPAEPMDVVLLADLDAPDAAP